MTRLTAGVVAALVVVGAGSAQPDAPAKSIEGKYKVVSAVFGGKEDKEKATKVTFEFKGDEVVIDEGGGRKEETATFKLDPSKTPAHIDITPKSDKTVHGIYKTKATKDGLEVTIAFSKDGGARPADFKGEGPREAVITLLRQGGK
jgi:uncharacterized protein (TIGR03067 family)